LRENLNKEIMGARKPKIAWLSPLPPQHSGIANYSYWLIKGLGPYVDIDLFCDEQELSPDLRDRFPVFPVRAFQLQRQKYDDVIYHLGNNSLFHREIYKLAWNFPGTIVLHDYNLSAFMHDAFYLKDDWQLYEQALSNTNGDSSKGLRGFVPRLRRNAGAFPMSHAVVNKSRKVVVHHRWVKDQFPDANHIQVIPHFARINQQPTPEQIAAFKQKFQINENHFVITCLGFINSNKLPHLQVEVAKRLLAQGYPVHLLFAGETAPEVKRLQAEVAAGDYRGKITFTGYLDEADYFSALFASDVVVNLRNPSMGEASGTLMHALAAAKPTIVSEINQYKEFPDRVCWKVTHDEHEAQLLYEYLTVLLSNRNVREALAENSLDYVESVLALDRIIPQWLDLVAG
jgi:glycosyltransferase involved in cell wall biosynthesis